MSMVFNVSKIVDEFFKLSECVKFTNGTHLIGLITVNKNANTQYIVNILADEIFKYSVLQLNLLILGNHKVPTY